MYSNQTSVITKNIQTHQRGHHGDVCTSPLLSCSPSSTSSVLLNDNCPLSPFTINRKNYSSESILEENYFTDYNYYYYNPYLFNMKACELPSYLFEYGKGKRRPIPIPNENKDDAYWERRRRNNESAKKSRESRRRKEMQTNQRILFLEQENVKLQTEVNFLREEINRLRGNEFFQYLITKKTIL